MSIYSSLWLFVDRGPLLHVQQAREASDRLVVTRMNDRARNDAPRFDFVFDFYLSSFAGDYNFSHIYRQVSYVTLEQSYLEIRRNFQS